MMFSIKVYAKSYDNAKGCNQIIAEIITDGRAVGVTQVDNLLFGLQEKDGVVEAELLISDTPFDGYTHEMYVYGAPYERRLSREKPYYEKVNGKSRLVTFGDMRVSGFFVEPICSPKDIIPVYVREAHRSYMRRYNKRS